MSVHEEEGPVYHQLLLRPDGPDIRLASHLQDHDEGDHRSPRPGPGCSLTQVQVV